MDAVAAVRRGSRAVLLVVSLQLLHVNSATCDDATTSRGATAVDMTELKRDIIQGLELEQLPDMTKVDISNDEFHRKYLEYFRRLYAADESEHDDATSYDNDDDVVSAIQVRGRVKHNSDDDDDDDESRPVTGDRVRTTIAFPIDRSTLARVGTGGRATVIKSVARIYGERVGGVDETGRVRVYGRLTGEKWSLVADLTWPPVASSADGGRWKDVDVTRLLRPRKRRESMTSRGVGTALELSLRHRPGELRVHDGVDRSPALHVFVDGPTAATADVNKKREKRDGGGREKRRRRTRPQSAGLVRRTDCKADNRPFSWSPGGTAADKNGTAEHGTNKCCREQMRVVFADIPGFDFIVEPKWFDAGLCRGRCPAKYNPATRHAFIQSLLWKQHNNNNGAADREQRWKRSRRKVRHGGTVTDGRPEDGSAAAAATTGTEAPQPPPPKPCCAPSKLDRLQIIHVDEMNPNSLKVTTWKQMSVVECACS